MQISKELKRTIALINNGLDFGKVQRGTKNSVRFKNVSKGYFDVVTQKGENGREVTTNNQSVDMAMAFDYDMLSTHYNINLEVSNTTEPDEFSK